MFDNVAHKHEVDPDFIDFGVGYRWGKEATDIIITGIKNDARPKVILRNLRDKNVFDGRVEPNMVQLYNKISHLKKCLKQTEKIMTTHDLRLKLAEHLNVPESEHKAYVPHVSFEDETDEEETRFMVVFATKHTLAHFKSSSTLHVDAIYRLVWLRIKKSKQHIYLEKECHWGFLLIVC